MVIAAPPFRLGGVKATETFPAPPVTEVTVGAPGTVAAARYSKDRTESELGEYAPSAARVAVSMQVPAPPEFDTVAVVVGEEYEVETVHLPLAETVTSPLLVLERLTVKSA